MLNEKPAQKAQNKSVHPTLSPTREPGSGPPREVWHYEQPLPERRKNHTKTAPDGTLFDKKGRGIIGEEGCSKFFMIGLAEIPDAAAIKADRPDEHIGKKGLVKNQVITCQDFDPSGRPLVANGRKGRAAHGVFSPEVLSFLTAQNSCMTKAQVRSTSLGSVPTR